jgi:hypothetical protein
LLWLLAFLVLRRVRHWLSMLWLPATAMFW